METFSLWRMLPRLSHPCQTAPSMSVCVWSKNPRMFLRIWLSIKYKYFFKRSVSVFEVHFCFTFKDLSDDYFIDTGLFAFRLRVHPSSKGEQYFICLVVDPQRSQCLESPKIQKRYLAKSHPISTRAIPDNPKWAAPTEKRKLEWQTQTLFSC